VPVGSYAITAKAWDNQGKATTSTAVNVTVNAAATQMYFIHTDHLNTPRLIANAAQQAVWRWDNTEPFGNNAPNEQPTQGLSAFTCNLRYPGQYFDKETNLHYNYFRDYDPTIGRYIQSDSIGLKGGINTYAYVVGNPLSYVDPFGLAPICDEPAPVCDGKGGFEICLGRAKGRCDEACSRIHEEVHIQDLKRERPDSCRNRTRGADPGLPVNQANVVFQAKTECGGYRAGLECRQRILRNTCVSETCQNGVRNAIARDEREIRTHCF
jgi:RHS repeat-associated protein